MRAARHIPELDGLRGVAIAGVMLLHFIVGVPTFSAPERFFAKLATYGVYGVDLFFVLSGFLITGILWDARGGQRYFTNFYVRRTLRIFPLYYAVLALIFLILPASLLARFDPTLLEARHAQLWVWPYLTNIYLARAGAFSIPYISHFWSLAVEEHFYLVWPFVVGLMSRLAVMRLCVVLALGALGLRIALGLRGVNETAIFVLTPCRLDTLCTGAWLALAVRGPVGQAIERRVLSWIALAGAAVVASSAWHAVMGVGDLVILPLRGLAMALFFGLVIFAVCEQRTLPALKRPLRASWLRLLGKYSYGLYIFHGMVAYWLVERSALRPTLDRLVPWPGVTMALTVFGGIGISLLISILSYELFESRLLKLKARFSYRETASPVAPVPASVSVDAPRP